MTPSPRMCVSRAAGARLKTPRAALCSAPALLFLRASGVFKAAAQCGSLSALQLLRSPGRLCPWDGSVLGAAAEGGCVEVLEWLHASGCLDPEVDSFSSFMNRKELC